MNGIIRWFVNNPIASNLMMWLFIAGGIFSIPNINTELVPTLPLDAIQVAVAYPGAGPREVEEQICVRIEEAVHDLDGVKRIVSTASEGIGLIKVEVEPGYSTQRLLNDVKSRVDSVETLPVDAEQPQVTELIFRARVISLALSGEMDEASLKRMGEKIRDEVANLKDVSLVELSATRPYELAIEIPEINLRRYGLSFDEVSQAIRSSSMNLPAGSIRSERGDVRLQTRGQAYNQLDFEEIVVLRRPDGTRVTLDDMAVVTDRFTEQNVIAKFNGEPSVYIDVYVTEDPHILKTNEVIREYVKASSARLPDGLTLTVWRDSSISFQQRLSMLLDNGLGGLGLVFIVLLLFLRPLLAFWVSAGIGIAFFGAFWLLPYFGVSINMISLFAFLLVLGIVVDDAIIVGESIYRQQERFPGEKGAIIGTQKVFIPIVFAVSSTMIGFSVMYFLPGETAKLSRHIPTIVLLILFFSLVEALFILPSHLSHMQPIRASRYPLVNQFESYRSKFSGAMSNLSVQFYKPFLMQVLEWRYLTVSIFIVLFLLSVAIVQGGWLKMAFVPSVSSDYITASIVLPEGGAFSDTVEVMDHVEGAALELQKQITQEYQDDGSLIKNVQTWALENQVWVVVELARSESRNIPVEALSNRWGDLIGDLDNVERWYLQYTLNPAVKAISYKISAPSIEDLGAASAEIQEQLSRYDGVFNVSDSLESARVEMQLTLKPEAANLSITLADLARQVRQGFYGEEVQRISRNRDDVKVMLRYPLSERSSIDSLYNMRIRSPAGVEVPFDAVAKVSFLPSYSSINRIDRKRSIEITAELAPGGPSADKVTRSLLKEIPTWQMKYPGFQFTIDGEQKEQSEFIDSLIQYSCLAMLLIYAQMAIPFKSYWQPIMILTAVPFGYLGSVVGHLVMGLELSMFSLMGITAAVGVVVNDNLVMIDRINELRSSGLKIKEAVITGATDRFRPIVLTSMTTFIGLAPMMAERSVQAQFLIPMVVSLAFGVLVATAVTLMLVPSLYVIGEGVKFRVGKLLMSGRGVAE